MCMFNYDNQAINSPAYKYGVLQFECGSCPECLQKKSRKWALRASMEAKVSPGMMITLTYDTYIYDNQGNIIGEQLRNDLSVNKKDAQNFIKRLRAKFPDNTIKYILTAEYGKRTHRPHYHALIFGLRFNDLRYYKRSKRGNIIYRSKTLEKIWHGGKEHKGGICTVDSVNLSAQTARYCTKYCAKDCGIDDTFMLFSRGIGDEMLLKLFNGISYIVEGREYSIPRQIWSKVIEKRYSIRGFSKYYNYSSYLIDYETFKEKYISDIERKWYNACVLGASVTDVDDYISFLYRKYTKNVYNTVDGFRSKNRLYRFRRDNDEQYKQYLYYWKRKFELFDKYRPSAFERIRNLPDNKYRSYKNKALSALFKKMFDRPYLPPRSNCYAEFKRLVKEKFDCYGHLAYPPRHYTPNDRILENKILKKENGAIIYKVFDKDIGRYKRICLEEGIPSFVEPQQIAWSDVENLANLQ